MDHALPAAGRESWLGAHLGGKYRIDGVLGHGGTGHVYRAIQEPMGRAVAVKVLRPDLPPEEQRAFEVRFLREASQAGALSHPNVVTVHDFGRAEDGTCFIVMELLRGRSLKDVLKVEGALPPLRALELFEQVIRGLRAAHVAGLVHRDVKPGNIFLVPGDDGQDRVKLLDFGLVKDLDAPSAMVTERSVAGEPLPMEDLGTESTITRHGLFLGTPHYVAPEQARGNAVDARADLYSAGVVLYRMVTGKLPYYDRNPTAMALAHIQQPYPPMGQRAPEVSVPEGVEAVVRRCMEKAPADRYPDADALLADLAQARRALLAPPSEATGSVATLALPPIPEAPVAKSRRWHWAGGGLLALALGLGVVLWPDSTAPAAVAPPVEAAPAPSAEPATRVVTVSISSEPSGAAVWLGGERLGTTPFSWPVTVPMDGPPEQRELRFEAEGRVSRTEKVTLDEANVFVPVVLAPVASPGRSKPRSSTVAAPSAVAPTPAPVAPASEAPPAPVKAPASPGTLLADGIAFTPQEAAATVAWLNRASHTELAGAGIMGRQVKIIEEGRPWADIGAFAATPQIGEKTVAAARNAGN